MISEQLFCYNRYISEFTNILTAFYQAFYSQILQWWNFISETLIILFWGAMYNLYKPFGREKKKVGLDQDLNC